MDEREHLVDFYGIKSKELNIWQAAVESEEEAVSVKNHIQKKMQ